MPGAKHLNEHEGLKKLIAEYNSKGKQIGAICAAPMVLGGLGILDGKELPLIPDSSLSLLELRLRRERGDRWKYYNRKRSRSGV